MASEFLSIGLVTFRLGFVFSQRNAMANSGVPYGFRGGG